MCLLVLFLCLLVLVCACVCLLVLTCACPCQGTSLGRCWEDCWWILGRRLRRFPYGASEASGVRSYYLFITYLLLTCACFCCSCACLCLRMLACALPLRSERSERSAFVSLTYYVLITYLLRTYYLLITELCLLVSFLCLLVLVCGRAVVRSLVLALVLA